MSTKVQKKIGEPEDPLVRIVVNGLRHAEDRLPLIYQGFDDLMYACQVRDIPETRPWFKTELENILSDEQKAPEKTRWRDLSREQIVAAAGRQIPGHILEYRDLWLRVMTYPRFAALAVWAMAEKTEDAIEFFGMWWDTGPRNHKHELKKFIQTIHQSGTTPQQIILHLRHIGRRWEKDLRLEVNEACRDLNFPALPFPPEGPAS